MFIKNSCVIQEFFSVYQEILSGFQEILYVFQEILHVYQESCVIQEFFSVYYTSSHDGERVENHKWIVHEELDNIGEGVLKPGTEVTTSAEHMIGMKDTTQEIVSSETTTVYMVDFVTADGQKVTNHKWVTESELRPLE
ncbi:DUF1541 domain-containing protein [Bacillus sp. HMF5848]|uniref:YdhK family protein n=1 Tax=Bacillus sp. HMF5848 TaxID=2495421 RepID=UPI000F78A394|nr:YdhK family protein [Bacillus sp. HMF5848]RSK27582.1 DUF1541 domain-containing protein [Bacillus sp. HMF5848]